MAWWRWTNRESSPERAPETAHRPAASHNEAGPTPAPVPAPSDWRRLAPLQRSVVPIDVVAPLAPFVAGLATRRDPRFIAPLGHARSLDAPSGEVALVAQRSLAPEAMLPELPVLMAHRIGGARSTAAVLQRATSFGGSSTGPTPSLTSANDSSPEVTDAAVAQPGSPADGSEDPGPTVTDVKARAHVRVEQPVAPALPVQRLTDDLTPSTDEGRPVEPDERDDNGSLGVDPLTPTMPAQHAATVPQALPAQPAPTVPQALPAQPAPTSGGAADRLTLVTRPATVTIPTAPPVQRTSGSAEAAAPGPAPRVPPAGHPVASDAAAPLPVSQRTAAKETAAAGGASPVAVPGFTPVVSGGDRQILAPAATASTGRELTAPLPVVSRLSTRPPETSGSTEVSAPAHGVADAVVVQRAEPSPAIEPNDAPIGLAGHEHTVALTELSSAAAPDDAPTLGGTADDVLMTAASPTPPATDAANLARPGSSSDLPLGSQGLPTVPTTQRLSATAGPADAPAAAQHDGLPPWSTNTSAPTAGVSGVGSPSHTLVGRPPSSGEASSSGETSPLSAAAPAAPADVAGSFVQRQARAPDPLHQPLHQPLLHLRRASGTNPSAHPPLQLQRERLPGKTPAGPGQTQPVVQLEPLLIRPRSPRGAGPAGVGAHRADDGTPVGAPTAEFSPAPTLGSVWEPGAGFRSAAVPDQTPSDAARQSAPWSTPQSTPQSWTPALPTVQTMAQTTGQRTGQNTAQTTAQTTGRGAEQEALTARAPSPEPLTVIGLQRMFLQNGTPETGSSAAPAAHTVSAGGASAGQPQVDRLDGDSLPLPSGAVSGQQDGPTERWASLPNTTALQRIADGQAPAGDASTTAALSPAPAVSAPGAPAGADIDIDDLARRLFDPLSARLRAELWLDRERAGLIADLRR